MVYKAIVLSLLMFLPTAQESAVDDHNEINSSKDWDRNRELFDLNEYLTEEGLNRLLNNSECLHNDPFPDTTEALEDIQCPDTTDGNNTHGNQGHHSHDCKMCCIAGVKKGKAHLKKEGCPYLQCRRMFMKFYKQHRRCIKCPFVCGYFFVKCCERQHHKMLYAPNSHFANTVEEQ